MMKNNVIPIILAGGQGTRIREMYPDIPKPMIPILGLPFLEWQVRFLENQVIYQVVISTGFKAEMISSYFNQRTGLANISCVKEHTPMGTAGGFLHAVEQAQIDLNDVQGFLVLNGDSFLAASLEPLSRLIEKEDCPAVIVGVRLENTERFGLLDIDPQGNLKQFKEKQSGHGIINAGIYYLRSDLIKDFPNRRPLSFEVDIFPMLLDNSTNIRVIELNGGFLDIGVPESAREAASFINKNSRFFKAREELSSEVK